MYKNILLILITVLMTTACQKENDPKKITYFVQGFGDPYEVVYTYGDGSLTKKQNITPQGISDVWKFSFTAPPGEITYLYIESKEDISASMSFNASILIDGKTFQKALSYDKQLIKGSDTVYIIKRSGTVPY